jgi:sugar phosphate isomerase/epimerase
MFRSPTAQTSDFAIDSSALLGSLSARLKAAKDAGFAQVVLCVADLALHPQGVDAAIADVRGAGLKVAALRGLDDFNGWEGRHREFKFELAQTMLELCKATRAALLMVKTSRVGADDAQAMSLLEADLRRLALLAIPFEVRIAYELAPESATPSRTDSAMAQALEIVERVEMPNIGICLDAAQASIQALMDDCEDLSLVSLVRVADDMPSGAPAASGGAGAAMARVFPGEGLGSARLGEAVKHLERHGYRGPWVFDANHPDYRLMPSATAADRAGRSARWLAEDVLRRSVPLPHDVLVALRPRGSAGADDPLADPINNP